MQWVNVWMPVMEAPAPTDAAIGRAEGRAQRESVSWGSTEACLLGPALRGMGP